MAAVSDDFDDVDMNAANGNNHFGNELEMPTSDEDLMSAGAAAAKRYQKR